MSQYRFLGEVTAIAQESNEIIVTCGLDAVRLSFFNDTTVRVTLAMGGEWPEALPWAITRHEWPGASIRVEETAEHYIVTGKKLVVKIRRAPCRFTFLSPEGRVLNADEPAFGMGWDADEVAVFKSLQQGERFFGLGEKVGPLDRRGSAFCMWNTDAPAYTDRTDPLYQSHPFYMGWHNGLAYGIFFNNSHQSYFNMGAGSHRLCGFRAEKGPLDYFFFAGPGMKDVLQQYSALVGRMPLPPLWALGYQQCRWSYSPEAAVRNLAQQFRDRQIPADVIYLDIHYMDGYRCFTFHPERFPQPQKLLADLREAGFKVVTIVDPAIKVDPGYRVHESGREGGHFAIYPDGEPYIGDVWAGPSHFPQFTREATRRWWGDLHADFIRMGVAGFWNDMNEPAVWGNDMPVLVQFEENGKQVSIKKVRNVYGHLMAQSTYEGLRRHRPEQRPFILTRAGFSGTQRYAASWTGDNLSTFGHLDLAIRLCLSMGLSGVPFVGADIGGFEGSPAKELFVRWMQAGAFTPLFRTHSSMNTRAQEPWSFGEKVEAIVRRYIELRYRLLPYTYTIFRQAAETGLPIMRPLFLEFPGDPETFARASQTTYLWGDRLLVAPVTRKGERVRKVYLPPGLWHDFWSPKTYQGGEYVYVDAPVEKLPLFVRAGSILPMREVQQFVGEKPLTNLELHVYPGADGAFTLYEDDGESLAYETGACALTPIKLHNEKNGLHLLQDSRTGAYQPHPRRCSIIFHGVNHAPQQVLLDGSPIAAQNVYFDAASGTARFAYPDDGRAHEVLLCLPV